jgi:hypothetical protein
MAQTKSDKTNAAPWCGEPLPDDRDGWEARAMAFKESAEEAEADVKRLRRDGEATVDLIMQDVVDLEYDTCDEEQPDLLHVTVDELRIILRRHILGEE